MLAILLSLFRLIWLFGKCHDAVALENLALRQQLAIYKRKNKRPRLIRRDRWFWIALATIWKDWRRALLVARPDTVVRWQRQRFRHYWADLSKKCGKVGRPVIGKEIRELIQTMARANPLWRAPRIHGELLKLGIEVSERTVSRILQTAKRPPSQTWKTFLKNHVGEIVAIDFFTVATIRLRVLFVYVALQHERRKVLHFGVTEHPSAEWAAQQVVEAFAERDAKPYLIRDRDAIYGNEFRHRIQSLGIKEIITAPRSPWQNAFAERLIGSIRRECLDHVVVLSQQHLREMLRNYLAYYHQSRTHLALEKDAPEPRAIMGKGAIVAIAQWVSCTIVTNAVPLKCVGRSWSHPKDRRRPQSGCSLFPWSDVEHYSMLVDLRGEHLIPESDRWAPNRVSWLARLHDLILANNRNVCR
jgi:putative transposase